MRRSIERLTERQKDCLRLVGEGYTSKEIGQRLGISFTTVDNHIRTALDLLSVENRAEAARLLRSEEHDQRLTSQPQTLAETGRSASFVATADRPTGFLNGLIPPLGGTPNELSTEDKAYAVIRIAVLGLASLIILTLVVAALLWLLR